MAKVKLTKDELQKLQTIQSNSRAAVYEFGQISLAEIDLQKRKDAALNYLNNLRNEESELAKVLEEKYGTGNINITTGEFEAAETVATGADSVELPKLDKNDDESKEEEAAEE